MSQFTNRMDTETFQVFWAALQRGEFISGAAEQIGTYRKQGSRGGSGRAAAFVLVAAAISKGAV